MMAKGGAALAMAGCAAVAADDDASKIATVVRVMVMGPRKTWRRNSFRVFTYGNELDATAWDTNDDGRNGDQAAMA